MAKEHQEVEQKEYMQAEIPGTEVGEESIGTIKIADDVVTMIAGYAVQEVEGVASMFGGSSGGLFGSKSAMKNLSRGVKVDLNEKDCKVDISIKVKFGYNIPAVSSQIQSRVKQSIESMTGLNVTDVNMHIAGITMTEDEGEE